MKASVHQVHETVHENTKQKNDISKYSFFLFVHFSLFLWPNDSFKEGLPRIFGLNFILAVPTEPTGN